MLLKYMVKTIQSTRELNLNDKTTLKTLNDFNAPYLEEKLLKDNKFKSREEFEEAFFEFKKYVALGVLYGPGQSMMSRKIDEVWHQFILFTPQYHEFCNKVVGRYLHHVPNTSYTKISNKATNNFVERYKETFGEIPEIWGLKDDCRSCHCEINNCDDYETQPITLKTCHDDPPCKSDCHDGDDGND